MFDICPKSKKNIHKANKHILNIDSTNNNMQDVKQRGAGTVKS